MNESQVKTLEILIKTALEWTNPKNINEYAVANDQSCMSDHALYEVNLTKEGLSINWEEKAGCNCCYESYGLDIPFQWIWDEKFRKDLAQKTQEKKQKAAQEAILKEAEKRNVAIKMEMEQLKRLKEKYENGGN